MPYIPDFKVTFSISDSNQEYMYIMNCTMQGALLVLNLCVCPPGLSLSQ